MTKSPLKTFLQSEQPSFQASKWFSQEFLIGLEEWKDLYEKLGRPRLFLGGKILNPGEEELSSEDFFSLYTNYVREIKQGRTPFPLPTLFMTNDLDALYALKVEGGKQLVRPRRPVLQMRSHTFIFSKDDETFRSMIPGKEALSWGFEISYPQLFEEEGKVFKTLTEGDFPNTPLFKRLQAWIRHHTNPTLFRYSSRPVVASFRLGSELAPWISALPGLDTFGLEFETPIDRLFDRLKKTSRTVAFAESCTGGAFSAAFTKKAGASAIFLGSLVAYSNKAKHAFLSVPQKTLDTYGAVSAETALAMCQGALSTFQSDFAISVTGIAGPTGGSEKNPVGSVFLAAGDQTGRLVPLELHLKGSREEIIAQAVFAAATHLLLLVGL